MLISYLSNIPDEIIWSNRLAISTFPFVRTQTEAVINVGFHF